MHYVYVLISFKDHLLYTGYTPDLKARIAKHSNGYVKSTKYRRPLKLIYYEAYEEEVDARKREAYLKGGKGKNELKIQLRNVLLKHKYKHIT